MRTATRIAPCGLTSTDAAGAALVDTTGVGLSGTRWETGEALGELAADGLLAAGAGAGVAAEVASAGLGLTLALADLGGGAACESLTLIAEFDSGEDFGTPVVDGAALDAGALDAGALDGVGRGLAAGREDDELLPAVAAGGGDDLLGAGGTEPRPEGAIGGCLEGACGSRPGAPALLPAGGIDGAEVST